MEKFDVLCKTCKKTAKIVDEDDGGCDDPECCGGRTTWTEAKCETCNTSERLEE